MAPRNILTALTIIVLVAFSLATTTTTSQSRPSSQQPDRGTVFAEYGPDPTSFDDLWSSADVIVRGSVEETSVRRSNATKGAVPITQHRVRVLEVLKGTSESVLVGQAISIIQMAGSLQIDGRQLTVDPGNMPILAPHQEIVAFLVNDSRESAFSLARGPAGLYVLDEDNVVIPREAAALRPLLGGQRTVSKTVFLATIRAEAARKGAER